MGCATSKPKVCDKCRGPCSPPIRRSYSMDDGGAGGGYHLVALTSSTLGSLKLDPLNHSHSKDDPLSVDDEVKSCKDEFTMGLIEAKTWSQMINDKIPKVVPKTPIRTPPGEPETINAWELMEGLEDTSPLKPSHHVRSFSFHIATNKNPSLDDQPTPKVIDGSPKPLWVEIAEDESNSNDEFDPEVISTFRKSLEDLPPANPFHLKLPIAKDKLTLYFTSLRGVRKTYEDCCHVRVILKGLGIKIDERDVSMHSGFKEELKELLGNEYSGGGLPRIFLGKKYVGGADEIRRLNEDGKLEKLLENCERVEDGGNGGFNCEACGDIRFVPCETCSGSCKIYYEADYEEHEDDEEDEEEGIEGDEYGFQRCPDCNENGLIRCPVCCD